MALMGGRASPVAASSLQPHRRVKRVRLPEFRPRERLPVGRRRPPADDDQAPSIDRSNRLIRTAVVRYITVGLNCGGGFVLTLQVLDCPICQRQFGLTVGTGVTSLDSLSDPFDAICVHCEAISPFHKGAVRTLEVGSRKETRD